MERGKRKIRTGIIVSNKMQKTAVVEIERVFQHSFYKKTVRRSVRVKAHDEGNSAKIGDIVEIVETRPVSRDKRWRIVKILGKGVVNPHDLPKQSKKEKEVETVVEEVN
ncbi:MAG: 30S ribosomal protein S17 [bacterium]|nr:30S ribosomal protein S17 [Candidatus Margulisiibacteriota bacterium]